MNDLVEVRVLTYRRPEWLRHALSTLISQSHRNWRALVFDDSPDREAVMILREFGDPRIEYRPNPRNLGCEANTNQAFQTRPYVGGSYACILEDDNWLLPGFLEDNISALQESGLKLLHRNQEIWSRYEDSPKSTGLTTLSNWYEPGVMTPLQLNAFAFLFPGISHGALFWSTDAGFDLYVDENVRDASLQEYCRGLQIKGDTLFVPECRAVYADVPPGKSRKPYYHGRVHNRFVAELWRQLVAKYGNPIVREAARHAERVGKLAVLERNANFIGNFHVKRRATTFLQSLNAVARGLASRLVIRNPIPSYHIPT